MAQLKPIHRLHLGLFGLGALVVVIFAPRLGIAGATRTILRTTPPEANSVPKARPVDEQPINRAPEVPANRLGAKKSSAAAMIQVMDQIRADLTNPQTGAIRLQRARVQIEMRYGRLFRRLAKLAPEKLEQLKTILAERDLNQMVASLPTDAELASGQTPNISQRTEANQSAADAEIKSLLGGDAYASYANYMDSRAYEGTVGQIVNIMQSQGVALGDEQQQAMLDAYGSAMKQLGQAISADSNQANGPASQRASDLARFDQILADTMSKALPPELFKQFMDAQYAQEDVSR